MATATLMKTALKVLYNKSPQNIYEEQVDNQADRIKTVTETDLRRMMKLRRKSWSVRALIWYLTGNEQQECKHQRMVEKSSVLLARGIWHSGEKTTWKTK